MKVTVCFGRVRVCVPCGDGNLKINTLVHQAITRYRRAIAKDSTYWVCVHRLEHSDGGILDLDDTLCDVVDDRDRLVCVYDEECPQIHESISGTQSPALSIASDLGSAFSAFQPYSGGLSEIEVTPTSLRTMRRSSDPALVSVAVVSLTEIPQRPDGPSRRKSPLDSSYRSLPRSHTPSHHHWTNQRAGTPSSSSSNQKTASDCSTNRKTESGYWSTNRRREGARAAQPLVEGWLEKQHGKEEDARIEPVGQDDTCSEHTHVKSLDDIIRLVEVSNDGGPLGIHVVPFSGRDRRTLGLLVRRLELGGKAELQGLFQEEDCIVRINNADLRNTHFSQAQSLFRQAMTSPLIQFHVVPKDKKTEYEELTQNTHTHSYTHAHNTQHTHTLLDNLQQQTHTPPHIHKDTTTTTTTTPPHIHKDTTTTTTTTPTTRDYEPPHTRPYALVHTPTHTPMSDRDFHTHTLKDTPILDYEPETQQITHTPSDARSVANSQWDSSFNSPPAMAEELLDGLQQQQQQVSPTLWAHPMGKPPSGLLGQSGNSVSVGGGPGSRSLSTTPTGTKKLLIGRKIAIQLRKGPDGLGFSLTTRDTPTSPNTQPGSGACHVTGSGTGHATGSGNGGSGGGAGGHMTGSGGGAGGHMTGSGPGSPALLCVKKILTRGSANQDGRLRAGDRILQVNGLDVSGRGQEEVVSLLRATPLGGVIKLIVLRPHEETSEHTNHQDDSRYGDDPRGQTRGGIEVIKGGGMVTFDLTLSLVDKLEDGTERRDGLAVMEPRCCVPKSQRGKKNPTVDTGQTFHRFLKGQALRREWINHIQRESGPYFKINAETKVCSEHFEKQCFVKTACGITKLIKHAVPTLFVWTSERPKMRIIIRRPSMDSMEVNENQPDERRDALSRGTSSTPLP